MKEYKKALETIAEIAMKCAFTALVLMVCMLMVCMAIAFYHHLPVMLYYAIAVPLAVVLIALVVSVYTLWRL